MSSRLHLICIGFSLSVDLWMVQLKSSLWVAALALKKTQFSPSLEPLLLKKSKSQQSSQWHGIFKSGSPLNL